MKKLIEIGWEHFQKHIWGLILLAFLSVVSSVFSTVCPYVLGDLFDLLTSSTEKVNLLKKCFLYLIVSVASMAIGYFTNLIKVKLHTMTSYSLNKKTVSHLQSVPYNDLQSIEPMYYTQRINNDSTQIMSFFLEVTVGIILNMLCIIVPIAILWMIYPLLVLFVVIVIGIYAASYIILRNKLYIASFSFKESQALFFGDLGQQLSCIKIIKLFFLKQYLQESLDNSFKKVYRNAINYQKKGYLFSTLDGFIASATQVCFLFVGGYLVVSQKITIGQMTIVISYLSLCLTSIRYFFSIGKQFQDTKAAVTRIIDIQTMQTEQFGKKALDVVSSIEIQNLSVSLGGKTIIKDFNAVFQSGKMYGIIGDNGAGKTTLINVLSGLYRDCYSGNLLFDGIPLSNFSEHYLHMDLISVCTQESSLINTTILENILLGAGYQEKIVEVIRNLNLESLEAKLPNGLLTNVGENGVNLSGGELQKINIARVLARDTPILVFDEPTSSMDMETKQLFFRYLKNKQKGRIIIVVTHDKSILSHFDILYQMGAVNE